MMDNKKLTAVEWLIEQMSSGDSRTGLGLLDLIAEAKEMEKEQHRVTAQDFYYASHSFKNFEQYYNETYGGGE
jgi:replication-associated recombination protein RarA